MASAKGATMSAIHSSRRRPVLGASIVFATTALAAVFPALAQEKIAAVFKAREVDFFYRSSTTFLPCHELQGRVATILRAIGARDDLQVKASGCENFLTPSDSHFDRSDPFESRDDPFNTRNDRFGTRRNEREEVAHVRVQLMAPVPVT